jgi:hypothetical protein
MSNSQTIAELTMEADSLARQANREMVAQNQQSSVFRNYQKADVLYAMARTIRSRIAIIKESK